MHTVRRILTWVRPYWLWLLGAALTAVGSVVLTLLGPVFIGRGIDAIIGPGQVDFARLGTIALVLAALFILSSLCQYVMTLCTNHVTYHTVHDLRTAVFAHIEHVPLQTIDTHAHGDLIARIVSDIEQVSDGLLQGFSQLFTGVITILGTLGFMFSVNAPIALIVVLVTPLSLFFASFVARRSHHMFSEQSALRGEIGAYVEEMIGHQKIVKAFGYEQRAQAEFEAINARLYTCGVKAQFYSSITNPGTRFVNNVVYTCVGLAGAFSALGGRLTIGQISCFLTYANQYTKPFNEISGVVTELQSALASAERIFAVLDMPEESSDAHARVLTRCDGTVDVTDVCFSYRPDAPLIEHLHLHAQPGQRIAIVGPTGCGKTTLINLLMRFYDIQDGRIDVSHTDIQTLTRSSLRSQYGMVLQDSWLFSGTIRDNIAYGRPDASEQEIIAAAKAAYAHGFIQRLPQGYDTVIQDDGGNLSQGQKQLLCIARIMLTQPPMLILDEATSSIDTRTELLIQQAFDRMMQGRTSFIVAHRLSTVRQADTILVMQDGRVVERGSHDQLLRQNGFYARLYRSQFAHSS